jgi:hypothetical protein
MRAGGKPANLGSLNLNNIPGIRTACMPLPTPRPIGPAIVLGGPLFPTSMAYIFCTRVEHLTTAITTLSQSKYLVFDSAHMKTNGGESTGLMSRSKVVMADGRDGGGTITTCRITGAGTPNR